MLTGPPPKFHGTRDILERFIGDHVEPQPLPRLPY